jgi:drug/metabolite transporter (DMT)-like permease
MTNPLRVWIAFALLSLAWGSSYLFIRLGLRQLTPLSLVGLRLLVGALVIGIIAYLRKQDLRLDSRQRWWIILVATINTAVPFLLISWGEVTVPSGLASVLNSTVPIFSVLLAGAVLHDEPVTTWRMGGVAIGFAGVVLLLSRDLTHGGVLWSHLAGQGAIVLASVCYAVAAVMTRRTLRGVPPLTIAVYVLALSTTEVLALSLVFSRPPLLAMHGLTVFSILWLGILGTGFAYVLAFFILSEWGAARYTLVAYMLPVVGLTLGAIVLSEHIDWRILGGSALVVLGIVLASIVRRPGGREERIVADRLAADDPLLEKRA